MDPQHTHVLSIGINSAVGDVTHIIFVLLAKAAGRLDPVLSTQYTPVLSIDINLAVGDAAHLIGFIEETTLEKILQLSVCPV